LALDVVVLLPEAFCEPLAFPVVEASLLSSLFVALAFPDDAGADVRVGWLLDCSEAEAESDVMCQQCKYHETCPGRTVVLSSEQNVLDVPKAVDVIEGVRHGGCDRCHGQNGGKQL
jgi:hypothetical protein